MNGAVRSNSVWPSKKMSKTSRAGGQVTALDQGGTTETPVNEAGGSPHVFRS